MNKSDYDKYYKKGGTYVIPVELFNELFDELERLSCNYGQVLEDLDKKNNIINKLEKHCETMLSIFEQMTDEQRQEQLDKYKIYDGFLRRLQELKGSESNE